MHRETSSGYSRDILVNHGDDYFLLSSGLNFFLICIVGGGSKVH
jgi:hypothetical protein